MNSKDRSARADQASGEGPGRIIKALSDYITIEKTLVLLVVACLLMRLHLLFVFEINWDEFLHLSIVHDHARGEIQNALQTIFLHGFGWVDLISVNEVDQVIAARLVIYVLGIATAGFLFLICRQFLPTNAALFAVFCYLSFSYVLRHGGSFRTDPIATVFLMAALWLIVCKPPRLRFAMLAGGVIGLAGMVTIKSIFYAPTIATILFINLYVAENRRSALLYGLVTASIAILGFLAFYFLHRLTLVEPSSILAFLDRTTGKTLGERNFLNAAIFFHRALWQNPVFWLAVIFGTVACLRGLIISNSRETPRWAVQLSFAIMLGSLLVYSQSYPYYYPFMLAPVAVLCGTGLTIFPIRVRPIVAAIMCIPIGLLLSVYYLSALQQDNAAQRRTLEVVHQAFPDPTPYIDRSSMVSAYPKLGFLMSVWGMQNYYHAGVPIMQSLIEQHQPHFLIANRRMLELDDLGPEEYGPAYFGLFQPDVDILKANFIRHWGAIYVAGKSFSPTDLGQSQDFVILIEGPYTVESTGPVILDGKQVQPEGVITLASGSHNLQMPDTVQPDTVQEVTLRWGDHLYRPDDAAPEGLLFHGF